MQVGIAELLGAKTSDGRQGRGGLFGQKGHQQPHIAYVALGLIEFDGITLHVTRSTSMTTVANQLQRPGSTESVIDGLVTKGRGTEEVDVIDAATSGGGEAADTILN